MESLFGFKPCLNCGEMPEISFEVVHTPTGKADSIGLYARCLMCGRRTLGTHFTSGGVVAEWNGGKNGRIVRT